MNESLDDLLSLEKLDINLFRSRHHRENFRKSLFGGQVLGQALMAVSHTVEGVLPSSLHAYFLRAGKSDTPVIYDVESVRNGNSISTRRVVARQHGRPIFNMSASFHKEEQGFEHQQDAPIDIAQPEDLIKLYGQPETDKHIIEENKLVNKNMPAPFELLPVDQSLFSSSSIKKPEAYFWLKATSSLSDSKLIHICSLAFASDLGLLATSLLPHTKNLFDTEIFAASIDHAMWFHCNDFRPDEWMLYNTFSPWAGKARGFNHGRVYRRDGRLVASTTQEGLIRPSDNILSSLNKN